MKYVKSCFLGKIEKSISKCHLLKILPRVVSVKSPVGIAADDTLKSFFQRK